jgi:DNA-binding response OmpR family regulator
MRILVVEDQDSIRSLIEALVAARGHQVTAVSTGSKALEMAIQSPPDIVLLDLNLPGQYDGFAVCRRLRATAATQTVPVVIISARDDAAARAEAAEIGATAFYGKPFSPMALLKEIEGLARKQNAASTSPRPRT